MVEEEEEADDEKERRDDSSLPRINTNEYGGIAHSWESICISWLFLIGPMRNAFCPVVRSVFFSLELQQ